ncbi:MAG: ABC transporter permease subunit [Oscillospiraceae bacterium]|jgi:sodium transport system permease protein|nr:ABC transporter permease subunit [Oscillospiraceae bacterium]
MKSYAGIIFRKEIVDIFRDRRSLLVSLILPILLYPAMFWMMGSALTGIEEQAQNSTVIVTEPGEQLAALETLLSHSVFAGEGGISVISNADPAGELSSGGAQIAVTFDGDGLAAIENREPASLKIMYDENKSASSASMSYFINLLNAYNSVVQQEKLAQMGVSLAELTPIHISIGTLKAELGGEEAGAGMVLSMILPMMVLIFLSVGAMSTAVDLFAGEKERRTFEPLLCTKARRSDILAGKLGAVLSMSFLMVASSVLGMALGYLLNPGAMTMGLDDVKGFGLPPVTLALTIVIIALMALMFSGIHVLLSTYARTVKEASSYGTFVMLASYIPIFTTIYKQAGDFTFQTAFIPVYNTIGCLKMVLSGMENIPYFLVTLGESALFVVVVLALGRIMFKKENIMLRA